MKKKILARIIGALCILIALAVTFLTTWVQIDGVSKKDIRTVRSDLTNDLDTVETALTLGLRVGSVQEDPDYDDDDYNDEEDTGFRFSSDQLKDDLQDNDLPYTKNSVKSRAQDTQELLDGLLNVDISLKEVLTLSTQLPRYVADTENLLNTDIAATVVTDSSDLIYMEDLENFAEYGEDISLAFYLIAGLLYVLLGLGVIAAITHYFNKLRFIKYIFWAVLLLFVVAICVGLPTVSGFIQDNFALPEVLESLSLQATAMPYVSLVLATVPFVLDIIFERKKKNVEV